MRQRRKWILLGLLVVLLGFLARPALPYRLHATVAQFREAYPQADRFFALKRAYDPGELFQNRFYERYGVGR